MTITKTEVITQAQPQTVVFTAAAAPRVEVGASVGFGGGATEGNGIAFEGTVHAPNLVEGLGLRADVSYSKATHSAADLELNGSNTVLGLGVTYPIVRNPHGLEAHVHGGVRYSVTSATAKEPAYKFDADVSHNAFGLGAGVQASYSVVDKLRVTGDLGVDHFFKKPLVLTVRQDGKEIALPDNVKYNELKGSGFAMKARVGVKYSF